MDEYPITPSESRPLPKPNPVTQKAHRQDVLRQLTLPVIVVLLVLAGVVFWLIQAGVGDFGLWAQISIVFIILPALIIGLILLVILAGLVFGIGYLLGFLPPYARITQDAIQNVKAQAEAGADISAKPIIQIQSFIAMIDTLLGRR